MGVRRMGTASAHVDSRGDDTNMFSSNISMPIFRCLGLPMAVGALCSFTAPFGLAWQPFEITVTHRARVVSPGEAVLVSVTTNERLTLVKGVIFDRTVRFYQAGDGSWRGLVGIDLLVEPGDHDLVVQVTSARGGMLERLYTLSVVDKAYPTRRLTVAPRYVEPPPDVVERITREAQQQTEIFASDTPDRFWRGGWNRPVPGEATSAFGSRSVFNGQPRRPHSGADFRAATGTPVKAPNGGLVVMTGDTYFSGGSVILDHGWGLYSYFAHLSKILVQEGDRVDAGQGVGHAGATGRVTGPHLHWTLRLSGARVDPLSLVELLP